MAGVDTYRNGLRSAVRGLWSGALDYFDAWEFVLSAIDAGFRRAWRAGAAECGISEGEYTSDEKIALEQAIRDELQYVDGLLEAVQEGSREAGGKLEPLYTRVELWVKRYNDVENRAKTMACADQKLRWDLGAAEHCPSCLKLAGKVRRASQWQRMDIRPQHPTKLKCMLSAGGPSVCQCKFSVTDERASSGPLPKLP